MKSRWFEFKEEVCELRRNGTSMTVIERQYGIPRSTLSGWFKKIVLTEDQRTSLMKNKTDGWKKARESAVIWHKEQKKIRLKNAENDAMRVLDSLEISDELLDVALAMLYFGEGAKSGKTSIGNANPVVLKFVLAVLYKNYDITSADIRCDLHLRADQDGKAMQKYWEQELMLPSSCFKYIAYDKRTAGKPTYEHYKGVCVITCNQIAIQRKLISLYNHFCNQVSKSVLGV